MKTLLGYLIFLLMLLSVTTLSLGQTTAAEEAKHHFDRGIAAIDSANSPAGYEEAIREFEQALKLVPNWADLYYNLGLVQEKAEKYDAAIKSYRQYLKLAPQADDAAQVMRQLNKLEDMLEETARQQQVPSLLEGEWKGSLLYGNGLKNGLLFYNRGNGKVTVFLPVSWIVGSPGIASNYNEIPVKIKEKNISFSFRFTLVFPERNDLNEYHDVLFELCMVDPKRLEGKITQGGFHLQDVVLTKN